MTPGRIGKYEIVSALGRGSMGEVFRAFDPIIGRPVALKTMSAGLVQNAELCQRFHREAQAAGSLNHPNVVTIFEFGEDAGQAYIAMELLDGSDLKELIARQALLTVGEVLGFMEQICDGLAFAHAREVVHRDLKPANIHVLPDGHVKIMDFGLARPSSSDMTQVGVILGTPHYMSPEQVRGEKADARSDVFSLGVVFYEMLARRKPFDADTMHSVLNQVVHEEPAPLREVVPGLPSRLTEALERALAKEPGRRFAHAGEMREALREARAALGEEEARQPLPSPPPAGSPEAPPALEGATVRTLRVPAPSASVTLRVPPATLRMSSTGTPRVFPGRLRAGGFVGVWERGRREPALAGAALLTLTVPLLAVAAVRHLPPTAVAAPAAMAGTTEAEALVNSIASGLAPRPGGAPPRVLRESGSRLQAALESRDATAASRELDRLVALDPAHPSLPAWAARLEGLLTDRVEELNEDVARARRPLATPAVAKASSRAVPAPRAPRPAPARSPAPPSPAPVVAEARTEPSPPAPAAIPAALSDDEVMVRLAVKDLERALAVKDRRRLRGVAESLSRADEGAAWEDVNLAILGVEIEGSQARVQVISSYRSRAGTFSSVRRVLHLDKTVAGWRLGALETR
jgi:eukaryotic-like serine/threonine-protein kinase